MTKKRSTSELERIEGLARLYWNHCKTLDLSPYEFWELERKVEKETARLFEFLRGYLEGERKLIWGLHGTTSSDRVGCPFGLVFYPDSKDRIFRLPKGDLFSTYFPPHHPLKIAMQELIDYINDFDFSMRASDDLLKHSRQRLKSFKAGLQEKVTNAESIMKELSTERKKYESRAEAVAQQLGIQNDLEFKHDNNGNLDGICYVTSTNSLKQMFRLMNHTDMAIKESKEFDRIIDKECLEHGFGYLVNPKQNKKRK